MSDEPLYFTKFDEVWKRAERTDKGTAMGFRVCYADPEIEGAAQAIADALNRLPQAEALLIEIAGTIREVQSNDVELTGTCDMADAITALPERIENWMVGDA